MEFKKHLSIEYIEKMPAQPAEKMPVLISLHGAGTRRTSLDYLLNDIPVMRSVYLREDSPFLVIRPLCHANTWFEIFQDLQSLVNAIAARPDVDPRRICLMGASMGGYGAWQLAMTMPDTFAAVVPICGGGMYWDAAQLRTTPVWAFHGALDPTVRVEETLKMVAAINSNPDCIPAKLTILENVYHDACNAVLESLEVREWMLAQRKTDEKIDWKNQFAGSEAFG